MGAPATDTTVQIFHFDTPNQKGTLPNLKDNLSGLGHACASFLFFLDSHVLIQAICKDLCYADFKQISQNITVHANIVL